MSELSARIERRRLELGMSRRQLADDLGCTVGAVQAVEKGADLDNWPFRLVDRLRDVLGWSWSDLVGEPPAAAPDAIATLGAELVRAGRVRQADAMSAGIDGVIEHLRRSLEPVGMAAAVDGHGEITLVPREDVSPLPRVLPAMRDRLLRGDLNDPEVEVVADVARGRLDHQRLGRAHARALATLLRDGIVVKSDAGYALADEVAGAFSSTTPSAPPAA